jgi:hypothetical protein
MIKGQTVTFRQGDAGNTVLTGTITHVWDKPSADPYVTVLDRDGRTFVRCSSHVTAADDSLTAYAKHVAHFLDQMTVDDKCYCMGGVAPHPAHCTPDPPPAPFGPGYVTDVCRCGHERGSHWDGEGTCDPAECGCRIFRDQQA